MRESDCQKLFKQGETELRSFPRAPVKKGYAVIPPGIGKDIYSLGNLIIKSVTLAENSLKKQARHIWFQNMSTCLFMGL